MDLSSATHNLELVLDRLSIEYPALVMETFLSIGKDEVVDRCATMGNGFCWVVSKYNIFVWSADTENEFNNAVQLPLPPSGLPYSSRSVVVYKNKSGRPGVLVVSGEGAARHWPSVDSSIHDEIVIDLASEVTLSVEFLERSLEETLFILTTTSGSVFLLRGSAVSMRGKIQWTKVGSRETPGIGRRFSSIIFGSHGSDAESSHVINSLIFQSSSTDDDADSTVVTISPNCLRAYDIWNRSMLWTINIHTLLDRYVIDSFERSASGNPVTGLNVWLLDAAKFRGDILLLLAGNHDNTTDLTFFLALMSFDYSTPTDVVWFSNIPTEKNCLQEFEVSDESSFIGRVFLCVPGLTANSSNCERTDGVIIIYPHYVQSLYLPDQLERNSNGLSLNKIIPFPAGTKLVGHACDERFCYVMTINYGISCVRLLPEGFEDDMKNDKFFLDDLMDIKESIAQDDNSLGSLVSAFSSFAAKNIVDACEAMKPLVCKSNIEFTTLVYTFLKIIIDRSVGSCPEMVLKRKKVVCNRTVLFLKHMGVYDKVAPTKVLISDQRSSRTGVSILAEMIERVSVAIALREWEITREDRAEVMEQSTKRLGQISNVHYGYDTMVYSTLSVIHNLPAACADIMRELMGRAVDKAARRRLVHLCADMLLTFANAIELCRRTSAGLIVPRGDVQWTVGAISDAYLVVCKILLAEMETTDMSQAERMRLRDCTVRLIMFHLSECNEPIDGHELIVALYDLDECEVAVELAEKFKDFKVLIKVCLEFNEAERRAKLDAYKKRFAADEFDMYLCRYLKRRNLTELLLEERGERADRYLMSCEEIRWRRELQNKQFGQASQSLLSLADRESSNVDRQRSLYAFAKLAAACADEKINEVIHESTRRLLLIKHQSLIPEYLMKAVYPDNPSRPLTVSEMIELNLIDQCTVDGHKRALYLVANILQDGENAELRAQATKIWISLLKHTSWDKLTNLYDIAATPFGRLLKHMEADVEDISSLLLVLPPFELLLKECTKELSVNESAINWIRGAIERAASAMRSSLDMRKKETEWRKNVALEIPETYFSGYQTCPGTDNNDYIMVQ